MGRSELDNVISNMALSYWEQFTLWWEEELARQEYFVAPCIGQKEQDMKAKALEDKYRARALEKAGGSCCPDCDRWGSDWGGKDEGGEGGGGKSESRKEEKEGRDRDRGVMIHADRLDGRG